MCFVVVVVVSVCVIILVVFCFPGVSLCVSCFFSFCCLLFSMLLFFLVIFDLFFCYCCVVWFFVLAVFPSVVVRCLFVSCLSRVGASEPDRRLRLFFCC